jgi:hypothetical protein
MTSLATLRTIPARALAAAMLLAAGCGSRPPCEENNGGCSPNATCASDKDDKITCTCDASEGYEGDGHTCTHDPCLVNNGGCGEPSAGQCASVNGAAQCTCLTGALFDGSQCVAVSLSVPATSGQLPLGYDATITGMGSGDVGALQITANSGTIEVQGTSLPAVAYEQIPFGAYTLYQMLAVAPDHWVIAWAYCNGGVLDSVYIESTNGIAGEQLNATGTCSATSGPVTNASVDFPAMDLPPPTLVSGFTVTGTDLTYDGAHTGRMVIGQDNWGFFPFTTVDCSTACGTPGWYELHSILWDQATQRACFGIYYLVLDNTDQVMLDYVICLPNLTDPVGAGAKFTATYTYP